MFTCPICNQPLHTQTNHWRCKNNHSFDMARQGYVNLLPVQFKKSKQPGDDAVMVTARTQFLAGGYYEPLQSAVTDLVLKAAKNLASLSACLGHMHVLDVGCGEGYYTHGFFQALSKQTAHQAKLTAVDISKAAAKHCAQKLQAKTHANVNVLVASASQLPLENNSINLATSIFAPIMVHELSRVLTTGGMLIIVKPSKHHLLSIRQALFDRVQEHDSQKFVDKLSGSFALLDTQQLCFDICLNPDSLKHLLDMTPYAYRAKPEKRQQLETNCRERSHTSSHIKTRAEFTIFCLQKLH